LWALPTVSEAEKEIIFRGMLADLDEFENEIEEQQKDFFLESCHCLDTFFVNDYRARMFVLSRKVLIFLTFFDQISNILFLKTANLPTPLI
jgi:type I restriction-modification system DNA methylase subunit